MNGTDPYLAAAQKKQPDTSDPYLAAARGQTKPAAPASPAKDPYLAAAAAKIPAPPQSSSDPTTNANAQLSPLPELAKYVDTYAKKFGEDPDVVATMLGIESAGGRNPKPSATGAEGVAQFMPGTASDYHVDRNNPEDSIRGMVQYIHDLRTKAEAEGGSVDDVPIGYNSGGGFMSDYLLGRAKNLSQETQHYLTAFEIGLAERRRARAAANKKPSEIADHSQATKADIAKHGKGDKMPPPPTGPPQVHGQDWLTEISGAMNALPDAMGALQRATVSGGFDASQFERAFSEFVTDPGKAADDFDPFSVTQLKFIAANATDPNDKNSAKFFLDHPAAEGAAEFAMQMLNPGFEGKLIGRGAKMARDVVERSDVGRYVANFFSPMRDIAASHGTDAKYQVAKMIGMMAQARKRAVDQTDAIFRGLDRTEQDATVAHATTGAAAPSMKVAQRGAVLRQHLNDVANTRAALRLRAVPTSTIFKQGQLPAENLEKFLRDHHGKTTIEAAFNEIQQKFPNMLAPLGRVAPGMKRAIDYPQLRGQKSVVLANSQISPAFANFLIKHGGGLLQSPAPKYRTGKPLMDAFLALGDGAALDRFNALSRQMIIENPYIHPFFNVATNANALGRYGLAGSITNYAKAIGGAAVNTIDGLGAAFGKGQNAFSGRFLKMGTQYAHDLQNALAHGALAERAASPLSPLGGSGARVRTLPFRSLRGAEKIDKVLAAMNEWNGKATFGRFGEEQFAVDLYKRLTKRGYDPDHAGYMVREAVGNFANVDPTKLASKLVFFFPWLKGNMAFWMRTALVNNKYLTAPDKAIRTYNESAGDPNTARPRHFSLYEGNDDAGAPQYRSLLAPQKMAVDVSNIATPLSQGKIGEAARSGEYTLESRLQPGPGLAMDGAKLAFDKILNRPQEPSDPRNFDSPANVNAPGKDQMQQLVQYEFGKLVPVPGLRDAMEALRSGKKPEEALKAALQGVAGLGYETQQLNEGQSRAIGIAEAQYARAVVSLSMAGRIANPQTGQPVRDADYINTNLQKAYDDMRATIKRIVASKPPSNL